jgi:hypothetical protein
MGNEYGAVDLQPHLVMGGTIIQKYDATTTTEVTILEGGHHQKMRLRKAYMMVVDAALSVADVSVDIKHGGSDAVAAAVSGSTTSPIGAVSEMTVVDGEKDLLPDENLTIKNDAASTTGDLLVFLTYELVA